MELNTYIATSSDLEECTAAGIGEVLIEPKEFSRVGWLSIEESCLLAQKAKARGMRPVLVWDLLLTERELVQQGRLLQGFNLKSFDAIRAQDLGAAKLVPELLEKPLQLSLEGTSHNIAALKTWCSYYGRNLERLILSIQLDEEMLVRCLPALPTPCELLGAGPVQMFYSRRKLLGGGGGQGTRATLRSEDSDGRPFTAIESSHGTVLYLDQDFFILDRLGGLERAGLHTVRIDLRTPGSEGDACFGIGSIVRAMRESNFPGPAEWKRGPGSPLLFAGNKTSAVFKDLKKHRYARLNQK